MRTRQMACAAVKKNEALLPPERPKEKDIVRSSIDETKYPCGQPFGVSCASSFVSMTVGLVKALNKTNSHLVLSMLVTLA